ncbi:MAG: cytochrome c [Chloroflexi bacterium]|nr:cytochrome c [Chloroflexota bacterium]
MRRTCTLCILLLLALGLAGCADDLRPGTFGPWDNTFREPGRGAPRGAWPRAGRPFGGHGPGMGYGRRGGRGHGSPHGMGPRSPWGRFHHLPVPEPYADLTNPMPGDPESIERGKTIYQTYCASCHGEKALGEAEAGQKLDPPAAPLAHTIRRVSDAYLFWRISEGGSEFGTAMPAYKDVLSEQEIWDVINYLRDLSNQTMPDGFHP